MDLEILQLGDGGLQTERVLGGEGGGGDLQEGEGEGGGEGMGSGVERGGGGEDGGEEGGGFFL